MNKCISFFDEPEQALNNYHEIGYHIEYNVLSVDDCQIIKTNSHLLSSARDNVFTPVMMPHRENPFFLTYMKNTKIIEIMSKLLNGEISGLQSQFFYMKPGTIGFTPHQDNYFVQAENDAFASAWIALDDTAQSNGGLIVYPKSHLLGLLPVKKTQIIDKSAQDPNAYRTQVELNESYHPINIEVPIGAVLFLHSCIVHGSNENKSADQWRHVLLNTYIRQGEHFRPGRDAKRKEVSLVRENS
jgi:ectoine hydroxylase-related dioxygenase (phytanoyl-CoA dioxygenase family)